jgi:hypothetical protein
VNRSEFIDYLLEKGECNRFDEHQIDAIEQFCFKLYDNTELNEPAERIAELNDIVSALTIADETGYVDGEGFVVGFNEITDEARDFLLAHNLEQQKKGVKDFFNSVEPYIQRGKSKMWRIDDIILDEYFIAKEGTK